MKKLLHALVLTGLVAAPALAMAAEKPVSPHSLSGNITLTSDYVFRGVSQSQNGPAIQGGADYSHASGFYLGTWASNVDWVSEGTPGGYKDDNIMEIDLYGGYKGAMGDIGYDVGMITYYYPGDGIAGKTDPDTTEVYLGASWKFLSLKYSHVVSDYFVTWGGPSNNNTKSKGSNYLELNASHDLGNGWGVIGHVGRQEVENSDFASYTDWKLGVSKDVGFGTVALAYSDTDADTATYTFNRKKIADGRVFASFSKSF